MPRTISNIALIAGTELKRTLITKKGLISLLAFSLVWLLILRIIIFPAPRLLSTGTTIGSMFGSRAIQSLTNWQVPELGAYWIIALYLLPMCCLVFAADQTASDKTRGTLKILTLHTSRANLFFGRFSGLMLIQGLIIAATIISTVVVALVRDPSMLAESINSAFFIWVNMMIVIAPYTALMALISLFAKSGMQAINYAAILWILLLFSIYWLTSRFPEAQILKTVFPGAQIKELVSHHQWSSLQTIVTPAIQTLIFLAAGLFVIHRIDL